MNKPRFVWCNDMCRKRDFAKCWKDNHIPFAGYLAEKYGSFSCAYAAIFERWLRFKKFAWPDETRCFLKLFMEKHGEFHCKRGVWDFAERYSLCGAVYVGRDIPPARLFVDVFSATPYSPKEKNRNKEFFKLATSTINSLTRR